MEGDTNERDLNGRTENANPEKGHNNEPLVQIRDLVAGDFVLVKSSGKMRIFNLVEVSKNNKIIGQVKVGSFEPSALRKVYHAT